MLNTKKSGSLISKLLIALFIFSMFAPQVIKTANAGNIKDTKLAKETNQQGIVYTIFRAKEDYTSAYGYNEQSTKGASSVAVSGSNSNVYNDLTYGPHKTLPIGAAYYFPNLVKERGYNNAALMFEFPGTAIAFIWWSPDSV